METNSIQLASLRIYSFFSKYDPWMKVPQKDALLPQMETQRTPLRGLTHVRIVCRQTDFKRNVVFKNDDDDDDDGYYYYYYLY